MPREVVVGIHQPNFFPWLGYFDKIVRADIFVVLDNVQFSKTGGTWSNRVKLLAGERPAWVTMPVVRAYRGVRLLQEMEIDDRQPWRRKLLQTLRTYYARAEHFTTVFPELARLIEHDTPSLVEFNLRVILSLSRLLNIETGKIVLASALSAGGDATDLLVEIVRSVGGTTYLCGAGSSGYLEADKFERAGVRLVYQEFVHPTYLQRGTGDFIPGLSCIDALMHCGFHGTRALLF